MHTIMNAKKDGKKINLEIDGDYHLFLYYKDLKEFDLLEVYKAIRAKENELRTVLAEENSQRGYVDAESKRQGSYKVQIELMIDIEDDQLQAMRKKVVERGRKRVFFLLGKQDYPMNKLKNKLIKSGYYSSDAEQILEPFISKAYINDNNLIKRRILSLMKSKSKKEIMAKLLQQGFDSYDIKEGINTYYDSDNEEESAYDLLVKKYQRKFNLMTKNEYDTDIHGLKQKMIGYLSRKGYPVSLCFDAVNRFVSEFSPKIF